MIDFDELVDNYLKRESKKKTIGRYYPSEIGGCLRKIWYSYKFPEEEKDKDLIKIFALGDMIHDFVVKVLESDKNAHIDSIGVEIPFTREVEDFIISGRIDNLILFKEDSKKLLIEVKSIKNINSLDDAKPEHKMQLQLYMNSLDIKNGVVLYIDKQNLKSKVFPLAYDEEMANKIIGRFKALHASLVNDIIPIPEARIEDKTYICRFCEYEDRCYAETPKLEAQKKLK
ncbi:TPA: Dna2/Cas4 domain-containing protein [archaeon]|jgi:CRISPR/Cas system-associated exonuclease Cas4 (RecB family)|uniref:Dna2/Cas4 domain-containing protein n=1 Tax=Candidatus Undinarchaeum marinum TaxID=2756141 RepID=A0A832UYX9_9ARCH|nr:Dna2/Cas4 domain-containing protein [Candidatus Undinarchaeum marinum]